MNTSTDAVYEQRLIAALNEAQSRSITDLFRSGHGASPDVIMKTLRTMDRTISARGITEDASFEVRPELHPLLFEWYFTVKSAGSVADVARGCGSSWLLLGVPSVAAELAKSSRSVALVDANPSVVKRFPILARSAHVQIAEVERAVGLEHQAEVVVIDPPWYLGDVLRWLFLAVESVAEGGAVVTTLFPELTRPSAATERDQIFAVAQRMGTAELYQSAVSYSTPLFEVESLASQGIGPPGDWRTADLLVIRKTRKTPFRVNRPAASTHFGLSGWEQFVIGSKVIMLSTRHGVSDPQGPALVPVPDCPANVLPTVSERDGRRAGASLWTSRNRVASVTRPDVVREWLIAAVAGEWKQLGAQAESRNDAALFLEIVRA